MIFIFLLVCLILEDSIILMYMIHLLNIHLLFIDNFLLLVMPVVKSIEIVLLSIVINNQLSVSCQIYLT